MSRQSIPNVIGPCPPPCDRGRIVVDDDMPPGLFFGIEPHEACCGTGIQDQAKYAPLDRIRRIIGSELSGLPMEGRSLDRLTQAVGEEIARIVGGSAPALADQFADGDNDAASRILNAMNAAISPFRRPLTYSSCLACHGCGCEACEQRGFVPARDYALMGERPLI
jgi:hypothetical protein